MKKFIIYFVMAIAFLNNNSLLAKHVEYDPNAVIVTTSDGKEIEVHYSVLLFSDKLIPDLEAIKDSITLDTTIAIPLSHKEFEAILPILKTTTNLAARVLNKKIDTLTTEDINNFLAPNLFNLLEVQVTSFIEKKSLDTLQSDAAILQKFDASIILSIFELLILKKLQDATNEKFELFFKKLNQIGLESLLTTVAQTNNEFIFNRIAQKKPLKELTLLFSSTNPNLTTIESLYALLIIKKFLLNHNNVYFKQAIMHDLKQFPREKILKLIATNLCVINSKNNNTSPLLLIKRKIIDFLTKMLTSIFFKYKELQDWFTLIFSQIFSSNTIEKKKDIIRAWNRFSILIIGQLTSHFPLLELLSQSKNPYAEQITTAVTMLKNYLYFTVAFLFSKPHMIYGSYSYDNLMSALFKDQQFMKMFDSIEERFKPIFRLTIGNDNIPIITESGISRVGLDFTSISKDILQLKNIEKQFQSSRLKKIFPERLARFLFSLKFDQEERRKILVGLSIGAAINAGVLLKKVIEYYHNKAKSGA